MERSLNYVTVALTMLITACSTSGEISDKTIFEDRDSISAKPVYTPQTELERRAYQEGVEQVLADFKGKMQASEDFVYNPSKIECGVKIPARVVNGALIPAHEECVLIKPGAFKQQKSTILPSLGE